MEGRRKGAGGSGCWGRAARREVWWSAMKEEEDGEEKKYGGHAYGSSGEQRKRKKMPSPGWGAGRVRVNGERRGERGEKREKCGEKSLELGGKRRKIGGWWGGPNGVLGKREKSGRKKIEGKMKSGPVVRSMGGERRSEWVRVGGGEK